MGGKIKGVEFIFALIATELRNCLTSKIAGWLKPITFTCSIFFSFFFFFLFSFSFFFLLPSSFFLLPSPRLLLLAPFSRSRDCPFLFELSHFPIPPSCSTLAASASLWLTDFFVQPPSLHALWRTDPCFCRASGESRARTVASTRGRRELKACLV